MIIETAVCDRCKTTDEEEEIHAKIVQYTNPNTKMVWQSDLCESCTKELIEWWYEPRAEKLGGTK